MSQAILISDNEVINSLYEVNLRAYVATNLTIKKSLADAIELIKHSPNIDMVICFRELNKEQDAIGQFHSFLKEAKLSIPVIVLGEPKETIPHCIVIKNKYDIKSLLQAMAKILEITAKDMAQKQVPKYFPIPIKLLAKLAQSHCDIYYRTNKDEFEYDYYVIIEKESALKSELKKYLEAGIEHLYIDANERLRFINKTSTLVVKELERDDLTTNERIEITAQGMGMVAEEIFENQDISTSVAAISHACIASINQVVSSVPKLKNLLSMLVENKSDYVYKHSILTTYFATEIIKNISWGSREQQEKVSFALFFHDLFLVPIYRKYPNSISEEDLLFREDVSDEDKKVVMDHARLAGEMIKNFPHCPMGADMIITQHHGMTSGQGFAVNYKDDISPLSKIIIIAEDIATGILVRLDEEKADKKSAVNKEVIKNRLLERYRNHTYRKIIDTLDNITFN
jgi:HD-GYP domain-containing protein (c-di-GMP phosphodiesterase class II)